MQYSFLNSKKSFLVLLGECIVFISSFFIKKDNNIWVFGAIRGQKYMDNAKYLFEYINSHTDIQAIWISKNRKLVDELKSKGYSAFYEYSSEALYYAKRAKVAIVTHRGNRKKADLPIYAFNKQTKIIQLWHGIPLKKIAYDDKIFSFKYNEDSFQWKLKVYLRRVFLPFLNYINKPSLILALSKETQSIFSQAFRTDKSKVIITGYPRNDILLNSISMKDNRKKKIIYMPTFRGSINSDFDLFLQYGFDTYKLDLFLKEKNLRLDIKLHPFNKPSDTLMKELKKSTNIFFLEHDAIYEIINEYDMLITDYSSIYFDYLLLNRPIIFAPFDKDTYLKKDRELYFDYNEVTPGPKAFNWDEVLTCLKDFEETPNSYADERKLIKQRFHKFEDANSTKRVYESILEILK